MTRLAILWKINAISFPTKVKTRQSHLACQCGAGEANPGLGEKATGGCSANHTERIKQKNMYGNRSISSPDVKSFYCQASQAIIVRPRLSSRYAAEDHTTRNSGWYRRRRWRPRKSWKDNIKEWTGQSMPSLLRIADDRDRWPVIASDAWICRNTPTTPGRHGY